MIFRTMKKYSPKPLFVERMKILLKEDFEDYQKILEKEPVKSIRVNTLKISPEKLKIKLEKKGWKIKQPWKNYSEVMIVESDLLPGELGRAIEHLLGYYYIQKLASMLPVIALQPKPNEIILDLCAAPGSKTTQIAAEMKNTGTIIANELSLGRLKILASNLGRCGATNTITTRKDGRVLCKKFREENFRFDKIILDAPCSGEGTLRSTPATYLMWNINTIKRLSRIQKQLFESAFEILKIGGKIIYSTCTHAPEENEEVVDYILEKFGDKIRIEEVKLPVKCRQGLTGWAGGDYNPQVEKSCRIYPQDNNTEGFFIAKFRRVK